MTKILIVEDNVPKAKLIASILGSEHPAEFSFANTISGAYSELEYNRWDLVILDMTFQVSQGLGQSVRKEGLAGLEVLQFMTGKALLFPVVVATQHSYFTQGGLINLSSVDELHTLLSTTFPKIYRGTVRVDLTTTSWHSDLIQASRKVLDVQKPKNSSRRKLTRKI